jgi:hypothetical protein
VYRGYNKSNVLRIAIRSAALTAVTLISLHPQVPIKPLLSFADLGDSRRGARTLADMFYRAVNKGREESRPGRLKPAPQYCAAEVVTRFRETQ